MHPLNVGLRVVLEQTAVFAALLLKRALVSFVGHVMLASLVACKISCEFESFGTYSAKIFEPGIGALDLRVRLENVLDVVRPAFGVRLTISAGQ